MRRSVVRNNKVVRDAYLRCSVELPYILLRRYVWVVAVPRLRCITFISMLGHVGIAGNERAGSLSSKATLLDCYNCLHNPCRMPQSTPVFASSLCFSNRNTIYTF